MAKWLRRAGDFLLAAGVVALSVATGGGFAALGAALSTPAFWGRAAMLFGVSQYSRHQQRKAQREASAANAAPDRPPSDNTVTIRSDDYPECIFFGRTRAPTILAYKHTHGDKKQFFTMVLAFPCRHELEAIERVIFDGKDAGLQPDGWCNATYLTTPPDIRSATTQFDGGPTTDPIYCVLAPSADKIVEIDSVALTVPARSVTGPAEEFRASPANTDPLALLFEGAYAIDTATASGSPGAVYVNVVDPLVALGYMAPEDGDVTLVLAKGTDWVQDPDARNVKVLRPMTTNYRITVTFRYIHTGATTTTRYWAYVHRNLGSTQVAAIPQMVSPTQSLATASGGQWTASDQLRGIPHITVTFEYDPDEKVWATGIPQVSAQILGAKTYDPTQDSTNGGAGAHRYDSPATWTYSPNVARALLHYLHMEVGCNIAEIDWDAARLAVVACDVPATVIGGTEPAFTCDGVISTAATWADNIERLSVAMMGDAAIIGYQWVIYAYAWSEPVLTLDINSLTDGDIEIDSRPGRESNINAVRGRYVDDRTTAELPGGLWVDADFPPRKIDAYITEDQGQVFWHDISLPLTKGAQRAQRMAIFYAHRARNGMVVKASFNLDAYEAVPGQRVRLPWAINGWNIAQDNGTGKVFQIMERTFDPPHRVTLTLREDAAVLYNWLYTAAVNVDPTSNTSLPPPNFVPMPVLLPVVNSPETYYIRADGLVVPYIILRWVATGSEDTHVEVYWKRADEGAFRRIVMRPHDTFYRIEEVQPGEVINAYLVARNALGAPSLEAPYPPITVDVRLPQSAFVTVGNLLNAATFEYGVGPIEVTYAGFSPSGTDTMTILPASEIDVPGYPAGALAIPGSPTNALGVAHVEQAGSDKQVIFIWPKVSIIAGQRFAFYAGLIGWATDCYVAVNWYGDGDVRIGGEGTLAVAKRVYGDGAAPMNAAASHEFTGGFATAPPGTRSARFMVVAAGNWTLDNPWHVVSILKPFFGRVSGFVNRFPAWGPGGQNVTDTDLMREGAATDIYTFDAPIWNTVDYNSYVYNWRAIGSFMVSPSAMYETNSMKPGRIVRGDTCTLTATIELEFDSALDDATQVEIGFEGTRIDGPWPMADINNPAPAISWTVAQARAGTGTNKQAVTVTWTFIADDHVGEQVWGVNTDPPGWMLITEENTAVYGEIYARFRGNSVAPTYRKGTEPFRWQLFINRIHARLEVIKR